MANSLKQHLVNTFGGCCAICGYNQCLRSLSFHHRDPSKKDFNRSKFRRKDIKNFMFLRELEKCVLLCSNCHGEVHSGLHKEKLDEIPEVSLVEEVF